MVLHNIIPVGFLSIPAPLALANAFQVSSPTRAFVPPPFLSSAAPPVLSSMNSEAPDASPERSTAPRFFRNASLDHLSDPNLQENGRPTALLRTSYRRNYVQLLEIRGLVAMWFGIPNDVIHREGVRDMLGFSDRGILECDEPGEWFGVTQHCIRCSCQLASRPIEHRHPGSWHSRYLRDTKHFELKMAGSPEHSAFCEFTKVNRVLRTWCPTSYILIS